MIRGTFVFFTLLAVNSARLIATSDENCVEFVHDVSRYYQSSCVTILHNDSKDMETLTSLGKLWRAFSKARIPTTTVRFSRLKERENLIHACLVRPTFVVLLNSRASVDEFVKLTATVNVKRPVWILPSTSHIESHVEDYEIEDYEKMIHLTYDLDVILVNFSRGIVYDLYALENRMVVSRLGTWKPGEGLVMDVKGISKHGNLHGRTLRAAAVPNGNLFRFSHGKIGGLYGDLIVELSVAMNFTVKYRTPSRSAGSWNKHSGNWSGMMSLISTNEVDIGVNGLSITSERISDVDFTMPLFILYDKLYFERPDVNLMYFGFRQAIQQNILIVAGPFILVTPVLLTIIAIVRGRKIFINDIIGYYLQTLGIYCQQGLPELPVDLSSRLIYLSIFMSSMVILAGYSAMLVSSLANTPIELPFSTIASYVLDGSYKLIVVANSATYDMFALSTDPLSTKMFSVMNSALPQNYPDGFDQICKEKVAFYTYVNNVLIGHTINCDVVSIKSGKTTSIALALPKYSPHREFINYYLQMFRESGLLNRLIRKYAVKEWPIDSPKMGIGLYNVSAALVLIISGMILAVAILFLEIIYFKYTKRCYKVTRLPTLQNRMSRKAQRFKYPRSTTSRIVDVYLANFASKRYKSHNED